MEKDAYTKEQLESFVSGIIEADKKIREISPDYLIVPLNGGSPLFDSLCIVDRELDPNIAVYFPASSKIKDSSKIVTNCFENFFFEREGEKDKTKLVSLDEIVSGNSVCRIRACYNSAARNVAKEHLGKGSKMEDVENEKAAVMGHFPYTLIGLREQEGRSDKFSFAYQEYVKEGKILPINVKKIITMDNPDYHTPRFDYPHIKGFNGQSYYPWLKECEVTSKYLEFLADIAKSVGVDPETVNPQNLKRMIDDSKKYSKNPKRK
jgi:hypothetical protein